jgi:hypothetical protein
VGVCCCCGVSAPLCYEGCERAGRHISHTAAVGWLRLGGTQSRQVQVRSLQLGCVALIAAERSYGTERGRMAGTLEVGCLKR